MRFLRLTVLVLLCSAAFGQSKDFALKDGDRVVFFGDSITEQRLYTSYVQQFVISRYPNLNVTFVNSGWTGDTVHDNPCVPCAGVGALARIERDVVAYKPTIVTLLFGMNDGYYKDFDPDALKAYEDGLSQIIAIIKRETKARIYVMTPTVYDAEMKTTWSHTDKYNEVLDRYSEAAKEIARRETLPVIDLHTATTVALMTARKADKSYTFFSPGDGVHPKAEGHAVMAAEVVRAWGAPENGMILTETRPNKFEVIWAPLPWPPMKLTEAITKADPIVAGVGETVVRFPNIEKGSYEISVDNRVVGIYTSEQLAAGISILRLSEAAEKDSVELGKAVRDKEDLEFMRWRTMPTKYGSLKSASEVQAALQKAVEEQFAVAREKAKFRNYYITLNKQGGK